MTFLKYLFIFFMFSIIGWIIELLYRSYIMKKIVNPGFMTGFIVPLYGFGAIVLDFVCTFFTNFNSNYKFFIIFTISTILLSFLEFTTGYVLFKIFNIRLWDYSDRKFNIYGFVCLRFSLTWGCLSLIFNYFIFPWINDYALRFVSNTYCLFSLVILIIAFLVDFLEKFNI